MEGQELEKVCALQHSPKSLLHKNFFYAGR